MSMNVKGKAGEQGRDHKVLSLLITLPLNITERLKCAGSRKQRSASWAVLSY